VEVHHLKEDVDFSVLFGQALKRRDELSVVLVAEPAARLDFQDIAIMSFG
jgi:hypothetical protein